MAYANYSDYVGEYGGSLIPQEEFNRWAGEAGGYLEVMTFGRCADAEVSDTAVPDASAGYTGAPGTASAIASADAAATARAVKLACCAVAEELWGQERAPALQSQRVGEWSRSYAPGKSPERRIADAARLYLRGSGLLWRGWKRTVNAHAQ